MGQETSDQWSLYEAEQHIDVLELKGGNWPLCVGLPLLTSRFPVQNALMLLVAVILDKILRKWSSRW